MAGSIGIASESVDWPGYPEVFVEVIKSCIPVKSVWYDTRYGFAAHLKVEVTGYEVDVHINKDAIGVAFEGLWDDVVRACVAIRNAIPIESDFYLYNTKNGLYCKIDKGADTDDLCKAIFEGIGECGSIYDRILSQ